MKLYKVTIEHTFFMVAENGDECDYDAHGCAKEAVKEDLELDLLHWTEVQHANEIPEEWRDACPYGEGGNVRSCRDWFSQGKAAD